VNAQRLVLSALVSLGLYGCGGGGGGGGSDGANTPYSRVTGTNNYSRNVQFNARNRANYDYFGLNARAQLALPGINSNLTFQVAWDGRNTRATDSDVDFGPLNIARANGRDRIRTSTYELRLDSDVSDTISTLVGLFYSNERTSAVDNTSIIPLGLTHTAPTPQSAAFAESGLNKAAYLANVAPGYTWTNGSFVPTAYQTAFSTAAGLTASARDYAAFSMAMDRDAFLKPATKALAWTPATSPSGEVFPYGLGWFATDYKGVRVIWHYGYWTASSTLVIKVPSQNLTFVLLANTDGLSSPYPLGAGKLDASPWARAFLETFVIAKLPVG